MEAHQGHAVVGFPVRGGARSRVPAARSNAGRKPGPGLSPQPAFVNLDFNSLKSLEVSEPLACRGLNPPATLWLLTAEAGRPGPCSILPALLGRVLTPQRG